MRDDDIDPQAHQFGRKLAQPIVTAIGEAELECNVLPFEVALSAQAGPQFAPEWFLIG
jgi:hypothetical protein